MKIRTITLTRKYLGNQNGLYGILEVDTANHGKFYFSTLENNAAKIQEGTYNLNYCMSPKFKYECFLLEGVEGRSGIRIHASSYPSDLQGCIALGLINKTNGVPSMLHRSRQSVEIFESLCFKEDDLKITIKENIYNETKVIREIASSLVA